MKILQNYFREEVSSVLVYAYSNTKLGGTEEL